MYSYLQPIIAAIVSVCVGMDTLTVGKILAAALVFVGVGVVNQSKAKAES
jgi:drug/metabolite transporter (DMT)-like permease